MNLLELWGFLMVVSTNNLLADKISKSNLGNAAEIIRSHRAFYYSSKYPNTAFVDPLENSTDSLDEFASDDAKTCLTASTLVHYEHREDMQIFRQAVHFQAPENNIGKRFESVLTSLLSWASPGESERLMNLYFNDMGISMETNSQMTYSVLTVVLIADPNAFRKYLPTYVFGILGKIPSQIRKDDIISNEALNEMAKNKAKGLDCIDYTRYIVKSIVLTKEIQGSPGDGQDKADEELFQGNAALVKLLDTELVDTDEKWFLKENMTLSGFDYNEDQGSITAVAIFEVKVEPTPDAIKSSNPSKNTTGRSRFALKGLLKDNFTFFWGQVSKFSQLYCSTFVVRIPYLTLESSTKDYSEQEQIAISPGNIWYNLNTNLNEEQNAIHAKTRVGGWFYMEFTSAEQWMMMLKALIFKDYIRFHQIREFAETDNRLLQPIGQRITRFDAQVWAKYNQRIVEAGTYLKYSNNSDLKAALTDTKYSTMVEANPTNHFYGIALRRTDMRAFCTATWLGENWLGKIITTFRDGGSPFQSVNSVDDLIAEIKEEIADVVPSHADEDYPNYYYYNR